MPFVVMCPNKHALQIADEHRNAVVRCPLCGVMLRIAGPSAPAAPQTAPPAAPPPPRPAPEPIPYIPSLEVNDRAASMPPPRPPAQRPQEIVSRPQEESPPVVEPVPPAAIPLTGAEDIIEESELHHPLEEGMGTDLAARRSVPDHRPSPASPRRPARPKRARPKRETIPPDEDLDTPGLPVAQRMSRVSLGLGFCYAKCICFVAAFTLVLIVFLVLPLGARANEEAARFRDAPVVGRKIGPLLGCVSALVIGAVTLCGWAGAILACFLPRRLSAWPQVILAAALEGLAVLLTLIGMIVHLSDPDSAAIVLVVALAISLVSWAVFMVFLSQLARFLEDPQTVAETLKVMVLQTSLLVGAPIIMFGVAASFANAPTAGVVILLGMILATLALNLRFLLRLLDVLNTLRGLIAARW